MSKYINIRRVHRAVVNFEKWVDKVNSQNAAHLWQFLGIKRMGVDTEDWTDYQEGDDFDFWDYYMKVRNGSEPYFDPIDDSFRSDEYPHNTAASIRKNTFSNRWDAAEYQVKSDSSTGNERWQLADDYLDILISKMEKGGSYTPIPLYDLIAWLFRDREFDDDAKIEDVKQEFIDEFNIIDDELKNLFTTEPIDHKSESEGDFFHTHPPNEEVIVKAVANKEEFDLTNALEDVQRTGENIRMERDGVQRLLEASRKQVILQGPPGSGKTYMARQVAADILGADESTVENEELLTEFLEARQWSNLASADDGVTGNDVRQVEDSGGTWDLVQFHPNYTYEDFVRGIVSHVEEESKQPVFEVENKTFGELAELSNQTDEPIILVIDEINRADLSKVLGELIYALEYRDTTVSTPYAVDGSNTLKIGANIRILGTMNTADRSIALIDYAIRRRFDFVDVTPDKSVLENYLEENAPDVKSRTLEIFRQVQTMFDNMPDYAVGHAYFMGDSGEEIANKIVFEVLPLLAEYQKEGVLREHVQIELEGWPGTGLPPRPTEPFDLVNQLESWLSGASAEEIANSDNGNKD